MKNIFLIATVLVVILMIAFYIKTMDALNTAPEETNEELNEWAAQYTKKKDPEEAAEDAEPQKD